MERYRKAGLFVVLAYAIAWIIVGGYVFAGGVWGSPSSIFVGVAMMWAPAIAAIVVQRGIYGEPIRGPLGVSFSPNRWLLVAWLLPIALVALTIVVGSLLPGVAFTTDLESYLIGAGLPADEVDSALAELEALPVPPLVLFIVGGLIGGATINALAAFGEELGWRGILLAELRGLGFWRASIAIGIVWGLWHAPVVLLGHNFPENPVPGVLMMTLATTAITPVYVYVTIRARSVLAPTLLHGSFNALAGFTLVFVVGGSDLLVSPVGLAGIVAALVVVGGCVVHDRYVAAESITTTAALPAFDDGSGDVPVA